VFYATNRRRVAGGFVARDADRMEYGVVTVHVPARHPAGALDRDLRVIDDQPLSDEAFLVALSAALDGAGPGAEILTYVHGYNNSFDDAARRTAQISHDLGMPTVPVLFAWPSHGGEWLSSAKYTFDENAAARSSSMFADLLDELMSGTAGTPVNVLAHSMGSRVVADALVDLDRRDAIRYPLDELVLAAPDVDAAVYGRRYLDLSLEAARHVTVYCASDDRALKLSRGVHGGYDRLGSCRPETISALERNGLDIVDASRLYVDLIDHDKVADSPRLLSDLASVLQGVPAAAPERALIDRRTHFELPP
jgi:esterase/lipase superfamily enzyme